MKVAKSKTTTSSDPVYTPISSNPVERVCAVMSVCPYTNSLLAYKVLITWKLTYYAYLTRPV